MTMKRLLLLLLVCCSASFALFNNTSTTNITLSHEYNETDMQDYFSGFYIDWGGYILGILALGFSFIFSDRYSQMFVMTGVGWVAIGFLLPASGTFILAGVVMLIVGSIMKYIIG